jgi:LysM repeat protein
VTHKLASSLTPHHTHKLTATATHHLYTVVRGDTLTKIAKRYHTTTSALVAANGLSHAGRLSIGQKLHIPSHESRTADEKPIDIEPHRANRAQLANNLP